MRELTLTQYELSVLRFRKSRNYSTMRKISLNYSSGVFLVHLMEHRELNRIVKQSNPSSWGYFCANQSIPYDSMIHP